MVQKLYIVIMLKLIDKWQTKRQTEILHFPKYSDATSKNAFQQSLESGHIF